MTSIQGSRLMIYTPKQYAELLVETLEKQLSVNTDLDDVIDWDKITQIYS